jgi:hypothetical protein
LDQNGQNGEKTMTIKEKMNPNKTARIAGFLYLIMLPLSVFSLSFVRESLIVPGDTAATVNNIVASEGLFRATFVSGLIYQVLFIFFVLVSYKLLKPVNKNYALLMVIFALVSVPIEMLNELNRIAALLLLRGADYLTVFEAGQLHALVLLFLDLHENGILIATISWGLMLFPLGYLVFKSGFLPRILGVLLIINGFGYLLDSCTQFLLPNYANYEAMISPLIALLTLPGCLVYVLWLLIKGVNVEQWERRAL